MCIAFKCRPITVLVSIIFFTSIMSCSEVRKLTYSEDFTYVEDKEVRKLMRKMSKGVEKLGQLTETPATANSTQQQVIAEINALESVAAKLSAGHTQTNQLFISDHIEQFSADLSTAKMFVNSSPADYSKVSEIVNQCNECHKLR